MVNYVLYLGFHAIYMDDYDIVLEYHLVKSMATININVENKFLKH